MNCAPESSASWQARIFSSRVQQMAFQNHLDRAFVGGFHDVPHLAQDISQVATILEPADV